jgi:16S rRNA (cytosine967-C5)-methyltransferase
MIAPARTAAYRALHAIDSDRSDLPSALVNSRRGLEDERDRALAAEIITGTLRWRRSIDHLIEHFAQRRPARMDPEVLTVLRLSVYQLLHLDRVPASAVVDDAVDLSRAARKPSASGFVNAVLRSILRQKHRLPLPSRPETGERAGALAYLGVTHSHPDWLVARLLDRYGFENAERWVRFDNEAPALTVRVNLLRASTEEAIRVLAADGIDVEPTRFAPSGLVVTSGNPLRRPQDGLVFVQDEASQLVTLVVGAHAGERVLDLCASPGGKTTAMAADMGDTGVIVASDVRARRVDLLRQTIHASGARSVRVVHVDTHATLPFTESFDRVLVDAPCSGLGTIRRDPDIRWRRREEDLLPLAADEARLLDRAAEVVRKDGRLVYATCSSEPEENEHVVAAFLDRHPEYELLDLRETWPSQLQPLIDDRGMFRTLPHLHGLEAFFGAALRRR